MTSKHPAGVADLSPLVGSLKRTIATVAGLNFAYFWVQAAVALSIGSVSLFADSVDFLEDTAVNLIILLAFSWPLARRAVVGKLMAVLLLVPAAAAAWQLVQKVSGDVEPPSVTPMLLAAAGAVVVNGVCAWLLARLRTHGGSLSRAAFLSARNDVAVNLSIIAAALLTAVTSSGLPDAVLGGLIILICVWSAKEVWEVAEEERLEAKALAGEELCC